MDLGAAYRTGFTLIELMIVLVVIGVLIAMLFPTLSSVLRSARTTNCGSNMRQIGIAMMAYATPRGGRLPRVTGHGDEIDESWMLDLAPYMGNVDEIRICPEDPEGDFRLENQLTSYVLNGYLARIEELDDDHDDDDHDEEDHDDHDDDHDDEHDDDDHDDHDHDDHDHDEHDHGHADGRFANVTRLKDPSTTIMLFEAADDAHIDHVDSFEWFIDEHIEEGLVFETITEEVAVNRHDGTANYLYADGHVETHAAETIDQWCSEGKEHRNFVLPK